MLTSWSIYSSWPWRGLLVQVVVARTSKTFERVGKARERGSKLPRANPMQLSFVIHQLPPPNLLKISYHQILHHYHLLETRPQLWWWNPCFGTIWIFCQPAMHPELLDVGMQFSHNPNFAPTSTLWIMCQLTQLDCFVNVMSSSNLLLCINLLFILMEAVMLNKHNSNMFCLPCGEIGQLLNCLKDFAI